MTKIRYYQTNPTELLDGLASLESTAEVEAYVIVMNLIYATGGSIMPDDIRLHRYCNQTKPKLKRTLLSLVKKGKLVMIGEKITQERCEIEIKSIQERSEKRSKAGQKGGRPKTENELNQLDKKSKAFASEKLYNKHNSLNNNTNHNSINNKTKLKSKKALKTDQTALKDFENLWKSWRKKSGRKLALESYFRSILTHSSQAIKNGAKQYNIENAETEKKFILMLSTFLNQERFLDYNFDEKQTDKTQKNESSMWEERCRWNKRSGYWSHDWGNPPDSPRNDVPEKYLIKYGFLNGKQGNQNPKKQIQIEKEIGNASSLAAQGSNKAKKASDSRSG